MTEKTISELPAVFAKIGADMKSVISNVRKNWWDIKFFFFGDGAPESSPSELFKGEDDEYYKKDNDSCFYYDRLNKNLYWWDMSQWNSIVLPTNSVQECTDNIITLNRNISSYYLEFKDSREADVSISTSNLGEKKVFSFDVILEIDKDYENTVSFSGVVWNKNKTPKFEAGKTYIIKVKIINETILCSVDFSATL